MSDKPKWIYRSGGQFYSADSDNNITQVFSQFAETAADLASDQREKNSWKNGSSSPMSGMMPSAWKTNNNWDHFTPRYESVSRGKQAGEVYYIISLPNVSGLFRKDLITDEEHRIFHKNEVNLREIRHHTKSKFLAATLHSNENAHIVMLSNNSFAYRTLTEGDVYDSNPSWDQEKGTAILYQSCGIGRDDEGHYAGRTAQSIEKICVKTGEQETLLTDSNFDFLSPQTDKLGNLYFIRRPMEDANRRLPLHKVILETVLVPFRMAKTAYLVVDTISKLTRKKPLAEMGPEQKPTNANRWKNIKGSNIDLSKVKTVKGEDHASIVPKSWKLIKRAPNGEELELASAILDFDVTEDSEILASDGRNILSIQDGITTKITTIEGIAEEVRWV